MYAFLHTNTICGISQNDMNTDLGSRLPSPMQYVIGQVFVKYAWEILAWMPEIYPSANFSMELRYSDSKLPVKINIKLFLKV